MKVLLLNPPFLNHYSRVQRSPAVTKGGTLYYPYWLCSAAGVLMQNDIDCEVLDAIADGLSIDFVIDYVKRLKFDVIVIETSTPSITHDLETNNAIKNACPFILSILCGTHVSSLPLETMEKSPLIDIIARGEYDYTILDIVNNVKALQTVLGITYRTPSGDIVTNLSRPLIANIDELPSLPHVYRKFLKISNYYFAAADYPMVMLVTGRGCYAQCFYCLYPQTMFGRKYRCMSAQRVYEEMQAVVLEFPQAREIVFEDDTFTIDTKRMREICQLLISHPLNIKWTCNARVTLDYDTMILMKRAGCRLLVAGFESGNQEILDRMKKGIKLDQSYSFACNARRAGLLVHGCFMFGIPGETMETMKQTFEFAKKLDPDSAQFYPVFVYPGTEAYEWARSEKLLVELSFDKWLKPDGSHRSIVDLGNGLNPETLTRFCESAYRRYYFRPKYIAKKFVQLFASPREGVRSLRSLYRYVVHTA